jgi:hypothetical protein
MGLISQSVMFEGPAPSLAQIVEKIVAIAGLPLNVEESSSEIKGGVFDLHATIGFAALPSHSIKIYTYRKRAVQKIIAQTGLSAPGLAKVVEGANERPGTETICLQAYHGQDLTAMDVATLALESLGGQPRKPISPEMRKQYSKPLSAARFRARAYSIRTMNLALFLGYAVCAVVLSPLILLFIAYFKILSLQKRRG